MDASRSACMDASRSACMDASRSARAFFVDPAHQVSCCHVYGLVEVTKTPGLDGIRDRLLNKLASLAALRGNQVLPIPVRPVVPSRRRSPTQLVETPCPALPLHLKVVVPAACRS